MAELERCVRRRFETPKSCRLVPGFPLTQCESQSDSIQIGPVGLLETVSHVAPRLDSISRPVTGKSEGGKSNEKSCPRPIRGPAMVNLQDLQLSKGIGFNVKEIGCRLETADSKKDNKGEKQENKKRQDQSVHWIVATDQINGCSDMKAAAVLEKLPLLPDQLCQDQQLLTCMLKIEKARRHVQNPNHDAYIHSLILVLLSKLTQTKRIPHTLLFFGSMRIDSDDKPPELLIVREAVTTTLQDLIQGAKPGTVEARHVLAWLFSTCFTLAYLQNVFGFIDDHFTPANIGLVRLDETRGPKFFFYEWNRTLFRVPTYGFLVKILPSKSASIVLNHHRVCGQSRKDRAQTLSFSYNSDLLSLGTHLQTLLERKLKCKSSLDTSLLRQILNKWCSCDLIRIDRLYSNCTEEEAKVCDRIMFKQLPLQMKCVDAIPALQSRLFAPAFAYREKKINNVPIFTLNEV